MSQLESLANELLLDIFEYLDSAHLVDAFFGLNSHVNQLLYYHFLVHQLCFQSILKQDFDVMCRTYLPTVIDQIRSLRLSNKQTRGLSELLLSRGFTLDRFIHLKSLSLSDIYSLNTIDQIIIQCHSLTCLTHLQLINCYATQDTHKMILIHNNIWSLPHLTHYTINDRSVKDAWFSRMSVVSCSLEYLFIANLDGYSNILEHLFEMTPRLQHLNTNICYWLAYDQGKMPAFSSLNSLKTSFKGDVYSLVHLLKLMPNLSDLILETWNICMNGHEWEELLAGYLPKIKIFQLKMNFDLPYGENKKDRIDQLVDTFRTCFWLEKHRWYVRCDYYYIPRFQTGILYTLSRPPSELPSIIPNYSQSTNPDREDFMLQNHIDIHQNLNAVRPACIGSNVVSTRFYNNRHLEMTFPLVDNGDLCHSLFHNLTSLHVTLNNVADYPQLQIILDQAHQLYSLKFNSFGESHLGLFHLASSSVRELSLLVAQEQCEQSFRDIDCAQFSDSSLGRRCEILSIEVDDKTSILRLIETMCNLDMLIVGYTDMESTYRRRRCKIDHNVVQWLKTNLPPTCLITIDLEDPSLINIRIHQQTTDHSSSVSKPKKTISRIFSFIRQTIFRSH